MDSALHSEEQKITTYNTADSFMHLHYKYGHLFFQRLRRMTKLGVIPKNFAKCGAPKCAACIYAKSTQKP